MKRSRLSVFIVYWLLCISSAVGAANFRLFQIPRNISGTAGPAKRYSEPVGPTDSASEDSPRLLAVSYSRDQRFYSLSCSLQFKTAAQLFLPRSRFIHSSAPDSTRGAPFSGLFLFGYFFRLIKDYYRTFICFRF